MIHICRNHVNISHATQLESIQFMLHFEFIANGENRQLYSRRSRSHAIAETNSNRKRFNDIEPIKSMSSNFEFSFLFVSHCCCLRALTIHLARFTLGVNKMWIRCVCVCRRCVHVVNATHIAHYYICVGLRMAWRCDVCSALCPIYFFLFCLDLLAVDLHLNSI